MADYTVILKHPDYAGAEDNGYCGTWQGHVTAGTPEDAIDEAIRIAAGDTGRTIGEDEVLADDWGFVAILPGHLDNLYTP